MSPKHHIHIFFEHFQEIPPFPGQSIPIPDQPFSEVTDIQSKPPLALLLFIILIIVNYYK